MQTLVVSLSSVDLEDLRAAKRLLEAQSLATRIAGAIGQPFEATLKRLPERWAGAISDAAHKALEAATRVAIKSLGNAEVDAGAEPMNQLHKVAATAAGAGGGMFGFAALPIELPVSTMIMLRSIAEIARSQGEDLSTPEARLACIEVFALGGATEHDDAAELGYFAARAAIAKTLAEAAEAIAQKAIATKTTPAVAKFIARVASRFTARVSQKTALQMVPAIGALGGGLVNFAFIAHYQDVARGHFIVRRLERKTSPALVRDAYARV
jgi:hypothetical protein